MAGWRGWFAGLLIVVALIGAVLHWGELRGFVALAGQAKPGWLVAALALQLTTYLSVALGWRAVLRRAKGPVPRLGSLVRIALTKLFADQALPTAGMGGNVLLVDQLRALSVPRGTAVAALLVSMLGFYAAYLLFSLLALLLLWLHGDATPLIVGVMTTFVLVAIAIPALALWLRGRGSRPLPPPVEAIRPIRQMLESMALAPAELLSNRRLIATVTGFNACVFAADILTLDACLRATGMAVSLPTALVAFILASIVVTLGPIPFGLGSFELVCTSTLRLLGVPIEAALAGTLMLRAMTLWLPLIPGTAFLHAVVKPRH